MGKSKILETKKDFYIIGVDGGGTKTTVVLANINGKIISKSVSGISNPRNVGIEAAAQNIAAGIYEVIKGKKK